MSFKDPAQIKFKFIKNPISVHTVIQGRSLNLNHCVTNLIIFNESTWPTGQPAMTVLETGIMLGSSVLYVTKTGRLKICWWFLTTATRGPCLTY